MLCVLCDLYRITGALGRASNKDGTHCSVLDVDHAAAVVVTSAAVFLLTGGAESWRRPIGG